MQNQSTKICFLLNPAANRHRSLKNVEWLHREVAKIWKNHEIVIAQKQESLVALAKEKSNHFDVIVACGGDGTVSQVVNGLAKTEATLGVLPIGSGNDFVKSLALDKTLPECLEILRKNNTIKIDLIRYEGDAEGWCANTLGLGMDGWANFYAHHSHWLKGRITYYYGAVKAILKFFGSEMEINSSEYSRRGEYVMATACNGKWEGGSFYVAPEANMQDGWIDMLLIKKVPTLSLISYLLRFRWGPADWMKGIKTFRTKHIEITTKKPVAVHRDGEHLGSQIHRIELKIETKALKVIVP